MSDTDQPDDPNAPVAPRFVVDDSQVLAVVKTVASLLTFASMFATALIGFARTRDLIGFVSFIQTSDVIKGLASAASVGWLVWRSSAAWRKKLEDIIIAHAANNRVAMTKSQVLKMIDEQTPAAPSPLTRASETATAVRRVDPAVLHRGGLASGFGDQAAYASDRAAVAAAIEPVLEAAAAETGAPAPLAPLPPPADAPAIPLIDPNAPPPAPPAPVAALSTGADTYLRPRGGPLASADLSGRELGSVTGAITSPITTAPRIAGDALGSN